MRSLNRGNIEGTNGLKIDVWFLYMDLFYIYEVIGFLDWLEKTYVYLRKGFQFVFYPLLTAVFKKSEYI